jgi:four helix bundle protein
MTPQELRARVDRFADQVITLCRSIASDPLTLRLLVQLQDAATSAAANYTSACRAQSKAAFVAKLSIALEEADESVGWLQRLSNHGIGEADVVAKLLQEAGEISAILNASRQTAVGRRRRSRQG